MEIAVVEPSVTTGGMSGTRHVKYCEEHKGYCALVEELHTMTEPPGTMSSVIIGYARYRWEVRWLS
jgi:hypothetical protein